MGAGGSSGGGNREPSAEERNQAWEQMAAAQQQYYSQQQQAMGFGGGGGGQGMYGDAAMRRAMEVSRELDRRADAAQAGYGRYNDGYGAQPLPRLAAAQQQQQLQHTRTVRNEANLKKASLELCRYDGGGGGGGGGDDVYYVKFRMDTIKPCNVRVYWVAMEDPREREARRGARQFRGKPRGGGGGGGGGGATPREPRARAFPEGLNQEYELTDVGDMLRIGDHHADDLEYRLGSTHFPLVIVLQAEPDPGQPFVNSQTTFATLVRPAEPGGAWGLKILQQSIVYNGNVYELQEIYGIEKAAPIPAGMEDDAEAAEGRECVICMCEPRDTMVLPCRHMCLCAECAQALRLQTNKCPLCRHAVESFLQIKIHSGEPAGGGGGGGGDSADSDVAPSEPPSEPPSEFALSDAGGEEKD